MNNIISAWSPNDLVLPEIKNDIDYGMWFVTDAGSIEGLDIEFNEGDWLIYLKKNGVGNWFKTTGGVIVTPSESPNNNPDPGVYTKFRLDNFSRIIDASYLEEKDLPKHKHAFSDINQTEFEESVQRIVSAMFQNKTFSSIKFNYDDNTKTITSEVVYDGTSLSQNEFGELTVIGGGGGGTGGASIEDLSCGSHTHDASQIENLKEYVIDVLNKNSSLNVKDIPIDGTTIILNSNGQLAAVAAGTQKHSHKMDDISDLNQNIANVWASNQPLQGNFSDGKWNFTNQTIGYSIKVMNLEFKNIDKRLNILENALATTETPEPGHLNIVDLNISYSRELDVVDKDTRKEVKAGISAVAETKDYFYPANYGELQVYIDEQLVQTVKFDETTKLCHIGKLTMTDMRDSWFGTPMYMGKYNSMKISYDCDGLGEGYHSIYFVHNYDDKSYKTKKTDFVIYQPTSPRINISDISFPSNNCWISGVKKYKYSEGDNISFTPTLQSAYVRNFIPKTTLFYTINGKDKVEIEPERIEGGNFYFGQQTIPIDKSNSKKINVKCTAFNIENVKVENEFYTNDLDWDDTMLEEYRVVLETEYLDQTPIIITSRQLFPYDSSKPVPKYELVVKNNIAAVDRSDYSSKGGADYSSYPIGEYYWINLKLPSVYLGNLNLTVKKGNGEPFALNRNGTLQDIKIYVAQHNTDVPEVWVDGNYPYKGYGSAVGLDFSGLDLFKSTQQNRQITFGQRPQINSGYLFVRIGVKDSIDMKSLVDSIKESINEWS